jgi:hypothetical protein
MPTFSEQFITCYLHTISVQNVTFRDFPRTFSAQKISLSWEQLSPALTAPL